MKKIERNVYKLLKSSILLTNQQKEWVYFKLESTHLSSDDLESLSIFLLNEE